MLTGGGHKNLTFDDGGEVQNGLKNADVINERPLSKTKWGIKLEELQYWATLLQYSQENIDLATLKKFLSQDNQSKSPKSKSISSQYTGWPKKKYTSFGVSGGTQVFAKQLNRHTFGFPTKNLTILDQYLQRFHCQKKDICNSAVFSPTALLKISFVQIILRLPVDISLIENGISYHNKYLEGPFYIYCSNQL